MFFKFLEIYHPLIAAFFIFFIFSYLLFNSIFKFKWNIFIHSAISLSMITSIYSTLYFIVKEPEENIKVIKYLNENKDQLINIKITDIINTTISVNNENIEVLKMRFEKKHYLNDNLNKTKKSSLIIYSEDVKNDFKNSDSIFISKEKFPASDNGYRSNVHYFCAQKNKKLNCIAGLSKVKILKESNAMIQFYIEF